jgi:hypothetical protein
MCEALSQLSQQDVEVRLARWLAERHMPELLSIQSLNEFIGDKRLKSTSPDVVAIRGCTVGIELTAYQDDRIIDSWGAILPKVRASVRRLDPQFPTLRGLLIGYSPDLQKLPPRKRDVNEFAKQLLEAVSIAFPAPPALTGKCRTEVVRLPDGKWPLLREHVSFVRATLPARFVDLPVDSQTGLACAYGTSVDEIARIIDDKTSKFAKAYTQGIDEHWLLIHAAGYPESSFITPLQDDEIERILNSTASISAACSPYAKVVLWDYIHGGYVDLTSGDCCPYVP